MTLRTEPSDEEFVRRWRDGDASAARILFDRHAPALKARVRRRMKPAVRARVTESDVVQEAYLAAFERLPEFEDRGEGSFRRWLGRIVDHKLVDEVRNHVGVLKRDVRREVRIGTGEEPSPRARSLRSPLSEMVAAERDEALEGAFAELSSDHRAVLRWIHQEGLTTAEAGACMSRSADAARKLYARALARLADLLERRDARP